MTIRFDRRIVWTMPCSAKIGPDSYCQHQITMSADERYKFRNARFPATRQCPKCGWGFSQGQFRDESEVQSQLVIRIEK